MTCSSPMTCPWQQKPNATPIPRRGMGADVFCNSRGDGKFYLYYTVNNPKGGKLIGVAVADHPLGRLSTRAT